MDVLDCEDMLCPLPVLLARKRLLAMPAGAVLTVRATDPMARIDLPHYCQQAGHELIAARAEGAVTVFTIRCK